MCGIFAYIQDTIYDPDNEDLMNGSEHEDFIRMSQEGSNRGPESSSYITLDNNVYFGFHRLAIQGIDDVSNQPMTHKHLTLICNGEIYNHKVLSQHYTMKTNSDCEVILHLYEQYGVDSFRLLDGEFAFILYDSLKQEVIVVRDPYGVRPLYQAETVKGGGWMFSSVLKGMMSNLVMKSTLQQVKPGTYTVYRYKNNTFQKELSYAYHCIRDVVQLYLTKEEYMSCAYTLLERAVIKRISSSDRQVCCLLSGGLDSSIVCAIATKYYRSHGKPMHTFSIGLEGSMDLYHASLVAKHLDSIHHEVVCTEKEFLYALPKVIMEVESYDTTTIRAGVGNWLIGEHIKRNTNFKVVLNGDGADELMGGYLYFNHAPSESAFQEECYRLLEHIHYFDVLRSDRCIASHGLEPRTPYLDKDFTQFYLSIPIEYRKTDSEKEFIRETMERFHPDLLPSKVLWRRKEAFSDGVSGAKPWYEIIQSGLTHYVPNTTERLTHEQAYYKDTFMRTYPDCVHLIPFYWMPRFVFSSDPSAKLLGNKRHIVSTYFNVWKHYLIGLGYDIIDKMNPKHFTMFQKVYNTVT